MHCGVTPHCSHCESHPKTIEHYFLCEWVKCVWYASPLCLIVNEWNVSGFELWLSQTLKLLQQDEFAQALVAYICWYIWKTKCNEVFAFKAPDIRWLIDSTIGSVQEFWDARNLFKIDENCSDQNATNNCWVPPCPDVLKLNTDSAYNADSGKSDIEAQPFYDVAFETKERELGEVIFESDCLPLVNTVINIINVQIGKLNA
ncbi:hypothetical protein K1719_026463 [Acacia pycnantha]|nr:hypothetical protein K1719_026463 [Acacia pycnantha]